MLRLPKFMFQKIRPILIQCSTVATMVTIGDTVAQRVIEKKKKQDYKRTARFAAFNFLVVGPAFRTWYYTLERLIREKNKWAPLKRVLIDQTMFAPFFIGVSIMVLEFMKGNSTTIALFNLKQIYPDILANNYKIWPFAQLINFYLVPLHKRVIFACLISIGWNIYFTWKIESKQNNVNSPPREKIK